MGSEEHQGHQAAEPDLLGLLFVVVSAATDVVVE